MTFTMLMIDIGLLLIAAGFKFKTVRDIGKAREEYGELLNERQRLHDGRSQVQTTVERLELQDRELTNDVRDLVRELSDLDSKIEKLTRDLVDDEG